MSPNPRGGGSRGSGPHKRAGKAPAGSRGDGSESRFSQSGRGTRRRDDPGRSTHQRLGHQPDRRELGGDQIEGRQAVLELLVARRREVKQIWIADGLDPTPELDKIMSLGSRSGARVMVVPSRRIDSEARTRSHQGVVARATPLSETSLDDLSQVVTKNKHIMRPFLLVLDGVTDPQNVGSLLRIAECAGVTGVVLARHNAAHVTPTVAKVAAGAIEYLRFCIVGGIPSAIASLSDAGVQCTGLDPSADDSIYEMHADEDSAPEGIALVLGDEGKGLGSLTRRRCTQLASIPQHGKIGSLNVAAAGAIACFELSKKMTLRSEK